MPYFTAKDGTQIYYKDWGTGPVIVFSHGWPLNSDAWDPQMIYLADQGFRCIAHDRRGHGRSEQPWQGNNMDQFADDLATLIETLNLSDLSLVGHSMGGSEVIRYIGRHGSQRVSRAVLIAAAAPLLLKTDAGPDGVDISVFDMMRSGVLEDRAKFFEDFAKQFYGANKLLSNVSHGVLETFFIQAMQSSIKSVYDCIAAFSETDFTSDLQKFNIPTLIIHGTDDQTVPFGISGEKIAKIVPNASLAAYDGAPHGLCTTHRDKINNDLRAFVHNAALAKA